MTKVNEIKRSLFPFREKLNNHAIYENIKNLEDVKIFMESHVFAVWDFMSLVKYLQINLTNLQIPWTPKKTGSTVRLINEIVLGEESDFNEQSKSKSHFEMYLDAMKDINANTETISNFINLINDGLSVNQSLESCFVHKDVKKFVNFTFQTINSKRTHLVASLLTFGREEIIPDIFIKIVEEASLDGQDYSKLKYYLNRHIEIDGEEHGPLALQMISEICGSDKSKWNEVQSIAIESLNHRINLWDSILEKISAKNN